MAGGRILEGRGRPVTAPLLPKSTPNYRYGVWLMTVKLVRSHFYITRSLSVNFFSISCLNFPFMLFRGNWLEILIPFPNFWWYTEPQKTGKNQPLKTVPLIIYNYLKHKRSQLLKKSEQNCSYQGKTLNFLTAFKGLWNSFVFEKVTKFPKNCTKSLNFRFFCEF